MIDHMYFLICRMRTLPLFVELKEELMHCKNQLDHYNDLINQSNIYISNLNMLIHQKEFSKEVSYNRRMLLRKKVFISQSTLRAYEFQLTYWNIRFKHYHKLLSQLSA